MDQPLRIAHVVPPMERVPPRAYGGTERVVFELVRELDRRGHEVTTFASGDSDVPGRLIATVPQALRPAGYDGDPSPYFYLTIHDVLDRIGEFDIIHSHLEWASFLLARVAPIPVVSTFHGRLDLPWADETFRDAPPGLVAISANQAATHPDVPWAGIVHNGLTLDDAPFDRRRGDGLCFVGRMAPEKGIVEAIEIALKTGRPLRIAAKTGPMPAEQDYFRDVFTPALKAAGDSVEYLGELEQAERDLLFAESYASLMPGSWPEPFGLVAIEALGVRHADHRPPGRRAARDHPRRRRRVLRRRHRAAGVPGRARRRPRPGGDPRVGHRPLLGWADDRQVRGDLPRDARGRRGRRIGEWRGRQAASRARPGRDGSRSSLLSADRRAGPRQSDHGPSA